jgi:EAL domain-containing protein (putative c-di-GMP-specific phosphodiesterase class I)/GGDEF domain-containing protein
MKTPHELTQHFKHIDHGTGASIHIDNFTCINLAFGFETALQLLEEFGSFLKTVKPESLHIFHLGKEEFFCLSTDFSQELMHTFIKSLHEILQKRTFLKATSSPIHISFSASVAYGLKEKIFHNCTLAHQFKQEHSSQCIHLFDPLMNYEQDEAHLINSIQTIKNALLNNTIFPYFQPIVQSSTGKIVRYECLVRVVDRNVILEPRDIIKYAKKAGILSEITRVMIYKSFDALYDTDHEISINLSEADFRKGDIVETLLQAAIHYAIAPARIIVEILEEISLHGGDTILSQIKQLKAIGFKIALDDFGAEKTNFSRIIDLNIDIIKIDGSFIKNLDTDAKSMMVVQTIVDLADRMKCEVVAEYVHSQAIYDIIKTMNIHHCQGYHFGEPHDCSKLIA